MGTNRRCYTDLISIWNQFIDQNAFLTQYFKLADDLDYEGLIELFKTDSRLKKLKDIPPPTESDELSVKHDDLLEY